MGKRLIQTADGRSVMVDIDDGSNMAELFAFEVPTSQGHFRIIGPDTLNPDEAERVGRQIARLIPLLVLPEVDPDYNPGYVMPADGDRPEPRADLIREALEE